MGIPALEIAGVIGTILLIIAWLWETVENIKRHKVSIHLHFSILYVFGNILLAAYAWWIHSMIFFVLGLFLLTAILGETLYAFKIGTLKHK